MKDMSDKLYCLRCQREEEFIIKEVKLEVEGLPRELAETVRVICCSECKMPIGAYTNNYYVEEKEDTKS